MDKCICCDATVPEGRMICLICEKGDIAITENGNRIEVFPMAPRKKKKPVIEACLEDMP